MRIILLLLLSSLIISCANTRTPSIPVEFGDRQTLYFTGKGAAAGLMMDSLLGGAGIAIGIAIDEGIAKDIAAAINKANPGFDIRKLVAEQLASSGDELVTANWQSVAIEKYGFQVVDGELVSPILTLAVNCTDGTKAPYFERNSANAGKVELDLIKRDGAVSVRLLQQAVEDVMRSKPLTTVCVK